MAKQPRKDVINKDLSVTKGIAEDISLKLLGGYQTGTIKLVYADSAMKAIGTNTNFLSLLPLNPSYATIIQLSELPNSWASIDSVVSATELNIQVYDSDSSTLLTKSLDRPSKFRQVFTTSASEYKAVKAYVTDNQTGLIVKHFVGATSAFNADGTLRGLSNMFRGSDLGDMGASYRPDKVLLRLDTSDLVPSLDRYSYSVIRGTILSDATATFNGLQLLMTGEVKVYV